MATPVLPPLPPSNLRSIDDLLTEKERAELHRDLAAMAQTRRRGEAAAGSLPMF